ncbi:MAG: acetylornithine transaminase [Mycobacteriales bacterium]
MNGADTMGNAGLQQRWDAAMLNTYGTPPIALVRGRGAEVWDADGNRYLDLLAGIAVNALGHAHPAIVEAVTRQVRLLGHTSNLYVNEPAVALAERLVSLLPGDGRVFFTNSGTEAVEAALKIVRRYGADHGKAAVVAADKSFHGRSMGALSITGNAAKREPFAPFPYAATFVPYGDTAALRAAVTDDTAAVVLEPTLGEAGVVPPPAGFLAEARAVCDEHGALLVVDEVQGGIGRTGHWFGFQAQDPDLVPDVVTLAKGLGGGLPIGACVALTGAARSALTPGAHGSTFAGNPVCAAAALAVLDTIEADGLLDHVTQVGALLRAGIDHPLVSRIDGAGLWLGLQLAEPVGPAIETACRERGLLVNAAVPDRLRLAPPLVLSAEQVHEVLAALPAVLDAVATACGGAA